MKRWCFLRNLTIILLWSYKDLHRITLLFCSLSIFTFPFYLSTLKVGPVWGMLFLTPGMSSWDKRYAKRIYNAVRIGSSSNFKLAWNGKQFQLLCTYKLIFKSINLLEFRCDNYIYLWWDMKELVYSNTWQRCVCVKVGIEITTHLIQTMCI